MERSVDSKGAGAPAAREAARPEQIRQGPHVHPLVDVANRAEELVLRADMPGAVAGGIDVRFEAGILTISGKVMEEPEVPTGELFREFVPADYYREFTVGEAIDPERITAEYEAGVLTLRLPKAASTRTRRIEVRRK
jgi:HSP20 family protein